MHHPAPWLAHYDAGVPPTLSPYPNRTLVDCLADAARDRPDAPALLFKGASLSNRDLDQLSDACAGAFQSLGVGRGDRVGLLLPNCPQFLIAQFASWKLGAIAAPLSPMYTDYELEPVLAAHQIETIVTLTRFYQRIKHLQPRTSLRRIVATNIKEYFPPVLRLLFTVFRETKDGDRTAIARGDHALSRLLLSGRQHRFAREPIGPDDPAVLLMSGGTTGTPKGVLGKHSAYLYAGLQEHAWVHSALNAGDVIFLPLPLFHVYANVGVQSLAFINGNPIALVPNPRDLNDVVSTVNRVKPVFFNGVPSLFIALLNRPDVQQRRVDFKSIKICFSGSAPLLADTKARFESVTGGRIVEGYSLTEAMMAACINPVNGPYKIGSVGMPLPDVDVRVFDNEDGTRELPIGDVGEIAISAPQLMVGYWNRPDETAGILRDHVDERGTRRYLHTGDLGYLDEDGYLFIVDRMKDLIKTSGHQVWPREIEEVLASHPSIAEVGVIGIPDPKKGEVVKACVVLRAGCQVPTEDELRAYCRERLSPYKVPARVEFRSELPKTMVGKVLRRALRDA
jgi:long-chain acyl-CoA synthetase